LKRQKECWGARANREEIQAKRRTRPPTIWSPDSISRVFHDLFDSCITVEDTSQAVFAKGDHAELNGFLTYDNRRCALVDETAKGVVDHKQFENALSTFVTSVIAIGATAPVLKYFVAKVVRGEVEHRELVLGGLEWRAAVFANRPNETLAEDGDESGRNQEGFDTHVD